MKTKKRGARAKASRRAPTTPGVARSFDATARPIALAASPVRDGEHMNVTADDDEHDAVTDQPSSFRRSSSHGTPGSSPSRAKDKKRTPRPASRGVQGVSKGSTKREGKRRTKPKQASGSTTTATAAQPPRMSMAQLAAMRAALLDGSRTAARVHAFARMLADAIVRAHRHTPLTAQLAEHIVLSLFAHVSMVDRARKSRIAIQRAGTAIMRSLLPDIIRDAAAFLDALAKDGSPAGDEGIARALSAYASRVDILPFVIRHEEALRKLAKQWDAKPDAKRESKYRVLARLFRGDGILVDEKTVKATIARAKA